MNQVRCLKPIGHLTKDRIYTVVSNNSKDAKWLTVVDDEGNCATYASDRFEPVLAPQVAPNFSEMQRIADEVNFTDYINSLESTSEIELICPVVEEAERRKQTHGPFIVANPDIKTSEDMATKPAMVVKHLKKCENHAECGQPAEAERYRWCYQCWWTQDPRNEKQVEKDRIEWGKKVTETIAPILGDDDIMKTPLRQAYERIAELENEVEVLRRYGNKDCTAMADEELDRQKRGVYET